MRATGGRAAMSRSDLRGHTRAALPLQGTDALQQPGPARARRASAGLMPIDSLVVPSSVLTGSMEVSTLPLIGAELPSTIMVQGLGIDAGQMGITLLARLLEEETARRQLWPCRVCRRTAHAKVYTNVRGRGAWRKP